MGLLDALNSTEGRLGLGLLAAAGPSATPMSFGQRLSGAMGQFNAQQAAEEERKAMMEERRQRAAMQALQMQQMLSAAAEQQKAKDNEAKFRSLIQSPQMDASQAALSGGGGPTVGNAAQMKPVDPMAQMQFEAMRLGQIKPLDYINAQRKDMTPIKLGRDDRLLQPGTNRVLVDALPKEDTATSDMKNYRDAVNQGFKGSLLDYQLALKRAGATSIAVNTGQKGFDNTLKLRSDFRSEPVYKAHQEMQSAYSQIQQSLKQASPAGDLAGATKIMKLLDPGSVVRESELGMAMAASGLMDRVQNYAQNILAGTKLTPTQRQDFQRLADALYGESVKQYNTKRGEYQGIAERNQLSVPDVLGPESSAPSSRVVDGLVRKYTGGR